MAIQGRPPSGPPGETTVPWPSTQAGAGSVRTATSAATSRSRSAWRRRAAFPPPCSRFHVASLTRAATTWQVHPVLGADRPRATAGRPRATRRQASGFQSDVATSRRASWQLFYPVATSRGARQARGGRGRPAGSWLTRVRSRNSARRRLHRSHRAGAPQADRMRLAAELIDSVEGPADPAWERAWCAELDRRSVAADAREALGEARGILWSEVRAGVRKRLAER